MSFTARNGTRGKQPPPAWLLRVGSRVFSRRIRRGGTRIAGGDGLVLITRGRKSGERRETPVAWFPGADGSWVVVASYNGAAVNPGWYWNLSADPEGASIVVRGEEIPVRAEELHDDDRASAWASILAASPHFAGYETATDRVIPIIRLSRREG